MPTSRSRKRPEAWVAEQLVLPQHHPVVAHLVLAGGEVAVPEQRQLLLERPLAGQHAVGPPQPQPLRLDAVGQQRVEELVHHRLQTALGSRRQHRLAQADAALARDADGLGAARRERIHAGIPDQRFVERLQLLADRLVVHQLVDGLLRRQLGEPRDLLGRGAEARPLDQMRGAGVVPVAGRDRR